MHLTFPSLLRGLFTPSSSPKKPETADHTYEYIRGDISTRGPCPGLNALANQGYLPRDGKNITLPQVDSALKTALHMSSSLASSLTRSLKPLLRKDGTFDLTDMRKHNVLEHDRSFTRLDFVESPTHDTYTFQPALFAALLSDASDRPITVRTLAKTYIRRKKESRAAGSPRLPVRLWFVNLLQTVSLLNTARTGEELSVGLVREFYEERFPDVVLGNGERRTLGGLVGKAVVLLWFVVF